MDLARINRQLAVIAQMGESVTYVARNFWTSGDNPKETINSLLGALETATNEARRVSQELEA